MAYNRTVWKDRLVQRPNTFTISNNPDGTVTLVPVPGTVMEPGTAINAATMNKIEQGIEEANAQLAENINSLSLHRVNADIHKPIFIRDRLPVSGFNIGDMVFVFENILSWEPSKWEKGSIASANGSLTVSETRIRTIDFIPVNPSTSYLVYDATPTTIVPTTITIVEYDASDVFVKTSGWIDDGAVITTAANTAKVKIVMQNSDSSAAVSVNDPQIISKPVLTQIY